MTDIETKIRDQKNKIKEDQRELSRLQDERRRANDLQFYLVTGIQGCRFGRIDNDDYEIIVDVTSNKSPDLQKIKLAIESLSEKKDEPDWDKFAPLDWACRDHDGKWHYAASKEALITCDQATLVHSEPESYVNWDKIVKTNGWPIANYVFVDKDGDVLASAIKPRNISCGWETSIPLWDVRQEWPDAIIGPLPSWDKSLIHRPGIKE